MLEYDDYDLGVLFKNKIYEEAGKG